MERNRDNVALIHRNISTLRYEDRGRALTADAYRWARGFEPIDDEPSAVFIDPPYQEFDNHPAKLNQLLRDLDQRLPAGSILVVESRCSLDETVLPDLERWDVRQYGGTQVAIRFLGPDGETPAPRRCLWMDSRNDKPRESTRFRRQDRRPPPARRI